jgi:hypothetical protein
MKRRRVMRSKLPRWIGTAAALGALLVVPACDRDDVDDHDDMHALEVVDRTVSGQPTVATWTLAGGWEGELPVLDISDDPNARLSLGLRAFDPDGDQLTLVEGGEFFMQYWLAPDAPEGVVDLDRDGLFHGDHVHVYGEAAGTTQIRFELWHVDHEERATGPISLTVVD